MASVMVFHDIRESRLCREHQQGRALGESAQKTGGLEQVWEGRILPRTSSLTQEHIGLKDGSLQDSFIVIFFISFASIS